jgi:hypothetical protein
MNHGLNMKSGESAARQRVRGFDVPGRDGSALTEGEKMYGKKWMHALALAGLSLAACGDDGDPSAECDSASESCGAGEQQGATLLGAGAGTYTEGSAATDASGSERTGYVFETEHGFAVEASFEAGASKADRFVFNSGALGTVGKPGFPGVDIQVVVDGEALEGGAFLSLDTVKDFGYSSLSGSYFINAALISGQDYVLGVTPGAALAGKSYTIELRGHVAE